MQTKKSHQHQTSDIISRVPWITTLESWWNLISNQTTHKLDEELFYFYLDKTVKAFCLVNTQRLNGSQHLEIDRPHLFWPPQHHLYLSLCCPHLLIRPFRSSFTRTLSLALTTSSQSLPSTTCSPSSALSSMLSTTSTTMASPTKTSSMLSFSLSLSLSLHLPENILYSSNDPGSDIVIIGFGMQDPSIFHLRSCFHRVNSFILPTIHFHTHT